MSIDDDLLGDLIDPVDQPTVDQPTVDQPTVDQPTVELTDGADVNEDLDQVTAGALNGVAPEVFQDLVARHQAALAHAATTRDQLLEARDQLEDAEGALAIAEAKQAALVEPSDAGLQPEAVIAREDVARRGREVSRAGRMVVRLERELEEADDAAAAAGDLVASVTPVEPEPAPAPANLYSSVYEFVPAFLAKVYARPVDAQVTGFRWCSTWWEHAEAVSRLEALWKAFETLRLDPGTGAAVWWRDFADPTMSALCGPEGPFKRCSDTQHKLFEDLPTLPAPRAFLDQNTTDVDPA